MEVEKGKCKFCGKSANLTYLNTHGDLCVECFVAHECSEHEGEGHICHVCAEPVPQGVPAPEDEEQHVLEAVALQSGLEKPESEAEERQLIESGTEEEEEQPCVYDPYDDSATVSTTDLE